MIRRYLGSNGSWLLKTLGGRTFLTSFCAVPYISGTIWSTFAKVTGSSGWIRLPIRKRVQVFPDLGKETRKTASGKTSTILPATSLPRTYFAENIILFHITP